MSNISARIKNDSNFMNLKGIEFSKIRPEALNLLISGEEIVAAFMTIRDQVVFTNKRIFVVNVQGISGKKISYFSYPYSKIQYYGIETAGVLDMDSELVVAFSNGSTVQFDFKTNVDIQKISSLISEYIL